MAKILIIDDDQHICRVLDEFLRRQGHVPTVACSGKAGLQAVAASKPDLILCDLEMPGLDGQEVVNALRQDRRTAEIPVIFLSGCTERRQIRSCMNSGGDDFITKPVQLPEILEAVNARLRRSRKQVQQLNQQIEAAAEAFVGIIHDLNKNPSAVQSLADSGAGAPGLQNKIIQQVRQSLDAGGLGAKKPVATPSDSLLLKNGSRQHLLKLSEVKALLADGEYSKVYWGKDQHMMFRKSLKRWQTELPAEHFFRVHRQAIINLSQLDFVEKYGAGRVRVHLREFKEVIPVSQRDTAAFNRRLKAFKAS